MKKDILYIWLQLSLGICSRSARELMIKFSSVEEIYNCEDFSFLGEKHAALARRLENKDTSEAFEVLKRCTSIGAGIHGYYDPDFPQRLRLIEAPPVLLYSLGRWRDLNGMPCVAVVGTRKMSDYGRETAERFAYVISKSGAAVISGLARGVDTAAHRGAVMAGGYTVAVLGNPIGDIYPPENRRAFETLYARGLVLSEMYPGCPRTRADFPNRNRIISGLCDTTVIAEAGEHSGALITAKYALAQGRSLFAVPGDIGAENAGTNMLIKKGVPAATEPYDIIAPLSLEYPDKIKPYEPSLTAGLRSYGNAQAARPAAEREPAERKRQDAAAETPVPDKEPKLSGAPGERILAVLRSSQKPLSPDEIARAAGLGASAVLAELTLLEIDGTAVSSAGNRYTATGDFVK